MDKVTDYDHVSQLAPRATLQVGMEHRAYKVEWRWVSINNSRGNGSH